ncbi:MULTISPECIES: ribonuclease D [unclassified Agarivorans]|uniref:ribonuclease D n=1 Tax=unclassified Agarivorans TaxID=2636026 RepID=UPI0026E2E969|nr:MULTISPECIES: ribonuclease D [unclassified Agarivorans]MDO6684910.1 ribonuclease D [Agarivorans sp. 3_MG-2023]MDO6714929.1 ribonuclease D [Agarivorans sp. 2_MG-2023]
MADVNFDMIETEAQLAPLLRFLNEQTPMVLAIDTEFVRTRTYYAQLGLLQIYDGLQCYLVDPLKVSMEPLWQALARHHWVLHAFSEDLEIIQRLSGKFGATVFDTQVGAAFLGHGISLGYQRFIATELEIELDKGESRTDWLARPLRASQLDYAALDVIYLLPAYLKIKQQLEEEGRFQAALEESTRLAALKKRVVNQDEVYKDIKNAWKLNPQQLAVLQVLCRWRIQQAASRDLAINNVVHGDNLWALARYQPSNVDELQRLNLPPQELRIHGQRLLKLVKQGQQVNTADFPKPIKRIVDYPDYKKTIQELKLVVTAVAEESGLPEDVLASKKVLNQYIAWKRKEHQQAEELPLLLTGWRKPLFANHVDQEG